MKAAVKAKLVELDPFSFNPIEFDGFNRVEFEAVAKAVGKHLTASDAAIKAKDGDFFIADWLRNRNTVEFLGNWEKVHNPDFNYGEYATIRNQAGLNSLQKLNRTAIHQMALLVDDRSIKKLVTQRKEILP